MNPTLVILAAGLGRRFGGPKQLTPIGPHGETILDYTVFDAVRAGFAQVVCVVRPEIAETLESALGRRWAEHLPVAYVEQRLDSLPDGRRPPRQRTRPWGTGQAVLATAEAVRGPFAVVNADDFYGRRALGALASFLRREAGPATFALVGFRLGDTLVDTGPVSRALCRCTADGWLQEIVEIPAVSRQGPGGRYTTAGGVQCTLPADNPVSLNLWGFHPAVFDILRAEFARFLAGYGRDGHCGDGEDDQPEFFLPAAIQHAIENGRVRVRILPADDTWFGVTHPDDLPRTRQQIGRLIDRGDYPAELWA